MDLAHLKYNQVKEGQIKYYRRKLLNKPDQMEIRIGIHPEALRIIEFYKSRRDKISIDNGDYIFPVLNRHIHESEQQKHDRIKKVLRTLNKELKVYAGKAGLTDHLTSKVIRHTALTELARKGVTIDVIQRIGGHKDVQTTRGYMKNADDERTNMAISQL